MPTAEGTFPKVGNDPIYASEVTRYGTRLFTISGKTNTISSGTAFQDNGSVVIAPGSLVNPCVLNIEYQYSGIAAPYLIISGANVGGVQHNTIISGPGGNVHIFLGSPNINYLHSILWEEGFDKSPYISSSHNINGGSSTNFSSGLTIYFRPKTQTNNTYVTYFIIGEGCY